MNDNFNTSDRADVSVQTKSTEISSDLFLAAGLSVGAAALGNSNLRRREDPSNYELVPLSIVGQEGLVAGAKAFNSEKPSAQIVALKHGALAAAAFIAGKTVAEVLNPKRK